MGWTGVIVTCTKPIKDMGYGEHSMIKRFINVWNIENGYVKPLKGDAMTMGMRNTTAKITYKMTWQLNLE